MGPLRQPTHGPGRARRPVVGEQALGHRLERETGRRQAGGTGPTDLEPEPNLAFPAVKGVISCLVRAGSSGLGETAAARSGSRAGPSEGPIRSSRRSEGPAKRPLEIARHHLALTPASG